eukprot:Em0002g1614a
MTELKVETLKDKQKEAICSFVNGRDCFVILPTGYGATPLEKSLHAFGKFAASYQSILGIMALTATATGNT